MSEACVECGRTDRYGREIKSTGKPIDLLPLGIFRSSYLVQVCGTCGFVEFRAPERLPERCARSFRL